MRFRGRLVLLTVSIAAAVAVLGKGTIEDILADRAADARIRQRADSVCSRRAPSNGTAVGPAAASPRGKVFVSHGSRRQVSILSLETGQVTRLAAGIGDAHEVAVSPDGRIGVAADFGDHLGNFAFDGRRLAVFDLVEKRLLRVIDLGTHRGPHDIHFLPGSSNRVVVTTQTTRNVIEVDVDRGEVLGATPTDAAGSHMLALDADGRLGFVANEADGTVSRLDLSSRVLLGKVVAGPAPVEGIAATPDGREVWVGVRGAGEVRVIDGATGATLASLGGFVVPDRLTMSLDGRFVLVTDFGCKEVLVVERQTRRVLGPIEGLDGAGVGKILPDGRTAIVAMLPAGVVAVVDLESRRVVVRHDLGIRIDAAAWGPDPAAGALSNR